VTPSLVRVRARGIPRDLEDKGTIGKLLGDDIHQDLELDGLSISGNLGEQTKGGGKSRHRTVRSRGEGTHVGIVLNLEIVLVQTRAQANLVALNNRVRLGGVLLLAQALPIQEGAPGAAHVLDAKDTVDLRETAVKARDNLRVKGNRVLWRR